MKKLKPALILLAALLTLFSYFGWRWFIQDSYRAFFAEHSGVRFPFRTANVIHFTEYEFAFTSHYSLPPKSRAAFAEKNRFAPVRPQKWSPIFHIEDLPAPWNQLPASGTFYYLTGADEWTTWDAMYHPESGSLWTSIYHADYGGDLPAGVLKPSP